MLQKFWGSPEESGVAKPDALIGDGCCKMRFATSAWPSKHQPPVRFSGEGFGGLVSALELFLALRVAAFPFRGQVIKGEAGEPAEVAVFL